MNLRPLGYLNEAKANHTMLMRFFDQVVRREETNPQNLVIHSWDSLVGETVVTRFIYSFDQVTDNEVEGRFHVGFNYPRCKESEIFKAISNGTIHDLATKPNGLKDLASTAVGNTTLMDPQQKQFFYGLYSRFFHNNHYYMVNDEVIYGNPEDILCAEYDEEYSESRYGDLTASDFIELDKDKKKFAKVLEKEMKTIKLLQNRFKIKRKAQVVIPQYGDNKEVLAGPKLEPTKPDHDGYFTFFFDRDLLTEIEESSFVANKDSLHYDFILPSLTRIPYYVGDKGDDGFLIDPKPLEEGSMDDVLGEDADSAIQSIHKPFHTINRALTQLLLKHSKHSMLFKDAVNHVRMVAYLLSQRGEVIYSFNDPEIVEAFVNSEIQKLQLIKDSGRDIAIDLNSWECWEYTNREEPTIVEDVDFGARLQDGYSDGFINKVYEYCYQSDHPLFRPYTLLTPVDSDGSEFLPKH